MAGFAFESIAQEVREQIIDGTYPVGCTLPSERELSERYRVSVGTVRVALKELVTEGTIDGGRGRPKTVVKVPGRPATFEEFRSFAQWATQQGMRPGGQTLQAQWRISSGTDRELLGVAAGTRVLEVIRLRTLNGQIVMLEQTRYPDWLGQIVESLPADTASVTAVLAEQYEVHFSHAEHVFGAEAARQQVAARLGVSRGAPLLMHRRVSRDSNGSTLEWSIDRYIAGKVMLAAGSSWHSTPLRWMIPEHPAGS